MNAEPGDSTPGQARDTTASAERLRTLERALLEGLGIAEARLPGGLDVEFMDQLGRLLRETTQGTIELLRLRAEAKSSLHADVTMIGSRAINPLKAAWDAEVALRHLLAPQRADMMRPLQAVTDAYDDLRLHDRGLASGIQAALAGLLARFSPEEFEKRLGAKSTMDSLLPANRKARAWDLLMELYEDMSVEAKQDFWAVFEKEFRRAYSTGQHSAGDKSA